MPDHSLDLSEDRLGAIRRLRATPKFLADPANFYFGAPDEGTRVECQVLLDALLEQLLAVLPTDPRSATALDIFRTGLSSFDGFDSDERDRVCLYVEEVMDILGIESSEGLLNQWRYGFNPGALPNA